MQINLENMIDFDYLVLNNFSGNEIDLVHRVFLKNELNLAFPFIPIQLKNNKQLEYMMPDANNIHVFCSNSIFHLIAYYNDTSEFPISRSYHIKTKDLVTASNFLRYADHQNIIHEIYGEHNYNELLKNEGNYSQRIYEYKNKNQEKNKIMQELFDGRKKNTKTDFGLRLSTERCMFCKNNIQHTVSTTMVNGKGFFFNYDVCDECFNDMQTKDISPLNYFSKYYTGNNFVEINQLSMKDILNETKIFLRDELNCIIVKFNKKDTITAIRKESNIKIIFRLTELLNYAYSFYENDGKDPFARIDSAKDHPELKFWPDHLHDSSIKKDFNRKVKESFTTGIPFMDKKAIIQIITKQEQKIKNKESNQK